MSHWWLRARRVLSGQFAVAIIGVLLLAALGGWLTYGTHVEPGTHVEQRQASSWSETADFSHAATVRERNPVYPVGTSLENRTVYFGAVAPILNGSLEYGYAATEGGNLTVATDASLVFQRVSRTSDGALETVYWQTTRELGEDRVAALRPGERVRVPFSFNVSELANRSTRIEDELGGTGGQTEALVTVDVALNGTVNGQQVSRTDRYALPVAVGEVYRVRDPGTVGDEYATTRSVAVENSYGPVRGTGGPLLFAVASLAAGGLLLARSRDALALPPDEREYLAYRDDRSDFDEWINVISLPSGAEGLPRAEAASLADLVDFAIDTDNSVVEDPDGETYHVIHDGYRYTYDPPAAPEGGLRSLAGSATAGREDAGSGDDDADPLEEPRASDD